MKKALLFLVFSLFLSPLVMGQDSFDPDELFFEARTLILDGEYIEGRKIAFRALDQYPEYADILILVGRSYAWEGKNDSASIYLDRAILASPGYEDAYAASLDNLFWSEQYDRATEVLGLAKDNFGEPLPDGLRYKKARLLYYQEDYDASYDITEELFEKEAKVDGLLGFMQTLQRLRRNSAVGVTYDYDSYFGDISPWNTFSLYGRTRTKLTGSLIARVTQSSRFDANGTLFELDAYPSLGENAYAYLNVGGSGASFFPNFRLGISVFYNLPNAWEVEGGYRYLKFSEVTNIYTASVGKYVGSWWFNLRANLIPGTDSGLGTSANFQTRYYFKTGEDFFSLQLSSGVSPDEESRDPSQLLNSYRVRLGYQQMITDRFQIFGFTGYSRDELGPDRFRNNLNISIGTEYRF
ncbi:YaiO family outer membrane beta-barrel protein [Algoriphagus halophytocola]|uniref:YaiO family outer membrane beta-barrel protein n=1 Tax=Algoriphagus halophytocola TaxID=2991499 RepID=A0ABY6MMV1_9BACT|nr:MULTISPECIES: YaiO family outer membrane beta-barrel protein [unclassified Algoriphagus]UZD23722.1 YaiO family outer membrane beta-barrel protein [Algoriphagus sp. TR-M5]WBL45016.1 YaiO family outer membrane beta-barrel protein [Algoriphagus sp. TR-M9]